MKLYFDTYALIALMEGRESYIAFKDADIFLTVFNLVEFYYIVLRNQGFARAQEGYRIFESAHVDVPEDVIFSAMEFRLSNRSKDLSYADCVGYAWALKNQMPFLTGDRQFKGLANVEFVQ